MPGRRSVEAFYYATPHPNDAWPASWRASSPSSRCCSDHWQIASSNGCKDAPRGVSEYSTGAARARQRRPSGHAAGSRLERAAGRDLGRSRPPRLAPLREGAWACYPAVPQRAGSGRQSEVGGTASPGAPRPKESSSTSGRSTPCRSRPAWLRWAQAPASARCTMRLTNTA